MNFPVQLSHHCSGSTVKNVQGGGYIEPVLAVGANNSNNNKYIFRALNPSVSNLHEARSAVLIQLKPNNHTVNQHRANKETSTVKKRKKGGKKSRYYSLHICQIHICT